MESGNAIPQFCIWTRANILEKLFSILGLAAPSPQTCFQALPHLVPPPHTEVSGPVISVFISSAYVSTLSSATTVMFGVWAREGSLKLEGQAVRTQKLWQSKCSLKVSLNK